MALEGYSIEIIDYKTAMKVVIDNHYLHRKAPASFSYGLFNELGSLVGVIVYGKPASPTLCSGIAGKDESNNVIELTRLWIADITPKNAESFLIASTLKLLPKQYDIIVSFAEIKAGHVGTVYQATNWIYTGLSTRRALWELDGNRDGHARHRFDQYGGEAEAKKILGDRLKKYYRPRKHRYIMFLGSKWRKRELMSKLKYEIKDYPKVILSDVGEYVLSVTDNCDSCGTVKQLYYVESTENYHCVDCISIVGEE